MADFGRLAPIRETPAMKRATKRILTTHTGSLPARTTCSLF